MGRSRRWDVIAVVLMLGLGSAHAETDTEKGLRLAVEARRQDAGWRDMQAVIKMVLHNRQGQPSVRNLRTRVQERPDDGDWSIVIFDEPKDLRGTALLTYSHKATPDDQWLYLPTLKRVKRIASSNKSGPFMGSEFAFEDLSATTVEKFKNYRWLRDEPCGEGLQCYVVERVPADANSGYARQVTWVDRKHYRIVRMDFYDRRNALLKTLNISGYRAYEGRYWRADQFEMVNHQTGKRTTLSFEDYRFGNGFTERDFDQNSLSAAR